MEAREYLKSLIDDCLRNPKLSYRNLAERCGFRSPNYLQMLVAGKKNLTVASASKIAAGLKLNAGKRRQLEILARASSARSESERRKHLTTLQGFAPTIEREGISDRQFDSHWLITVIWQMAQMPGFALTVEYVQSKLRLTVPEAEIAKAIGFLRVKGYLVPQPNGLYLQRPIVFQSTNDIRRIDLQAKHRFFLYNAIHNLDADIADRENQGLTITVPKEKFAEMRLKLREFVVRLNEEYSDLQGSDAVIRLQCSMVKLTH
jgi:uncharacterized protein (TIGR02147 family)